VPVEKVVIKEVTVEVEKPVIKEVTVEVEKPVLLLLKRPTRVLY
jgi:hypothetical protein